MDQVFKPTNCCLAGHPCGWACINLNGGKFPNLSPTKGFPSAVPKELLLGLIPAEEASPLASPIPSSSVDAIKFLLQNHLLCWRPSLGGPSVRWQVIPGHMTQAGSIRSFFWNWSLEKGAKGPSYCGARFPWEDLSRGLSRHSCC